MRTKTLIILFILFFKKAETKDFCIVVLDYETKKAISNVELLLIKNSIDFDNLTEYFNKEDLKISGKTNENGEHLFKVKDSTFYSLAVFTENYLPYKSKITYLKDTQFVYLIKCEKNKRLKVYPAFEESLTTEVFIGTSFKSLNFKLDYKTKISTGFDITDLKETNNLSEADIYTTTLNDTILDSIKTHIKGGLIPIIYSNKDNSLLFEKNIAPKDGYVQSYKYTGQEEGFFLKIKNGLYSKIVLARGIHSTNIRDEKNRVLSNSSGIIITKILVQEDKSNDLTYCIEKLNLENYILWNEEE